MLYFTTKARFRWVIRKITGFLQTPICGKSNTNRDVYVLGSNPCLPRLWQERRHGLRAFELVASAKNMPQIEVIILRSQTIFDIFSGRSPERRGKRPDKRRSMRPIYNVFLFMDEDPSDLPNLLDLPAGRAGRAPLHKWVHANVLRHFGTALDDSAILYGRGASGNETGRRAERSHSVGCWELGPIPNMDEPLSGANLFGSQVIN